MRLLRPNTPQSQRGFVQSAELIFIAVILVLGLVTGWTALRNQVVGELYDTAKAIGAIDQGYGMTALVYAEGSEPDGSSLAAGTIASTAGSAFQDGAEVGQTGQITARSFDISNGAVAYENFGALTGPIVQAPDPQ